MHRSYEISSRAVDLGGGWNLKLIEDGQEAGGGVFSVQNAVPAAGVTWWNNLNEEQRAHWLILAASAVPADAYHAYLMAEAHNAATDQGESWAYP